MHLRAPAISATASGDEEGPLALYDLMHIPAVPLVTTRCANTCNSEYTTVAQWMACHTLLVAAKTGLAIRRGIQTCWPAFSHSPCFCCSWP